MRQAAVAIAEQARTQYRGTICAVTGSVGKSSTCILLRHALGRFGSCARNRYNKYRGVIGCIATLSNERFAVVEVAGALMAKESSRVLRPHVAILTAIAPAHLEKAETMLALADRKAGIFIGLEPGGIAIINRDVPFYERVSGFAKDRANRVISYGIHEEAEVRLVDYNFERQVVCACVHGERLDYELGMKGRHMALNSLAALAAVHALGLDWREAASDLGSTQTPRGRCRINKATINGNRIMLIDDAFNANPASMDAAIELLASFTPLPGGKRIAVLADMLELGVDEARFHAELAKPIIKAGIDRVYVAGKLMGHLWNQLPTNLRGCKVATAGEILPILLREIGEGDVVLFKGSHGSRLFAVVQALRHSGFASSIVRMPTRVGLQPLSSGPIQPTSHVEESTGNAYTLTLCGDTSLGDYFTSRYKTPPAVKRSLSKAPLSFFDGVRTTISDSSCLIVNLETTLVKGMRSPLEGQKKHIIWDDPERTVTTLKGIGVTAVNLANNHAMDFGSNGLLQSVAVLKAAGLSVCGAGETRAVAASPLELPMRVGGAEKTLFVIAAYEVRRRYSLQLGYYATAHSPGVNALTERVTALIAHLRTENPEALIVACPHWFQNYRWANEKEIDLSSALISAGADIVFGNGAHMLGQCRWSESGTIVLSLGDFVFNWPGFHKKYRTPPFSLIARLAISKEAKGWSSALKLYPIITDNRRTGFKVQPVDRAVLATVYSILAERAPALAFRDRFEPAKDERGPHLRLTCPISPRFVCS